MQGSTSSETAKASPKGLAHIPVTLAVHHQKRFRFSSFQMPSLPLQKGCFITNTSLKFSISPESRKGTSAWLPVPGSTR